MLVKGATPVEILRQYMAKGDSPTRGRELNIHFGDTERGFIGQISHLGDMVPVMAGVTLSFKMRGEEPRVGLVYVGDGATSTGAFHEGINFAAVQRCPLVVIVENNGYAYSTPTAEADRRASSSSTRRSATASPACRPTATTCSRSTTSPSEAVDRARRGEGVTLIELMTYRRKGHAEHDNQSYVPGGRDRALGRRERSARPLPRARSTEQQGVDAEELERDRRAGAGARSTRRPTRPRPSPPPEPLDALRRRLRRSAGGRRRSGTAKACGRAVESARARRVELGDATMAEITYLEAIREALFEEMERDPNVFCLGEDIGAYGGAFKVTEGLLATVRRASG